MDWTDVAKVVAPIAPTIGGIIGGIIPIPGAALAGQAFGALIAKQFGVPATPDAVHAAVTGGPNDVAIAKLRAAADEARAQYPAYAEIEKAHAEFAGIQVTQVNETMRAELASDSKFKSWWRPMNGWVLAYENFCLGTLLFFALIMAIFFGDKDPLKVMQDSWPLILAVLGVPAAVVGVAVFSRGWEKVNNATQIPAVPVVPAQKPALIKPSR